MADTHAKRTLAAIEATIENRATLDQQSYTIAGRSLARTQIYELLQLRDKYAALVAREERLENPKKRKSNLVRVRI